MAGRLTARTRRYRAPAPMRTVTAQVAALPVAFAIILVQIVMGLLARSAPQLNLFAVGFPAALLAGIVLLAIAAPVLGEGINAAIGAGLDQARRLALGG